MNFLNNEKGVSEVVGALLVFLILVVILGTIQVQEVPKWNKELERQNFDTVSAEFINLKSDLEDVSSQFVPKTSALHMGVKYPERFMLRNPGPAYGTLSTYPLNITVNYTLSDFKGQEFPENKSFQSNGIEYEFNGLSQLPKLVYEHGLMISDFGKANLSNDKAQSLIQNGGIFIPIVNRNSKSFSSIETESLNIEPLLDIIEAYFSDSNNTYHRNISKLNITMETKYPNRWSELLKESVPSNDTNINVSVNGKIIYINLSNNASTGKYLYYPKNVTSTGEAIFSGMIKYSYPPNEGTIIINRGGLPFTNIKPDMLNYPNIRGINITESTTSSSQNRKWDIKAYVDNSSKGQIYADLTAVTENIWMYNVNPDSYNSTTQTATWSNLTIPNTQQHQTIVATFWAKNGDMQYYTQAVFYKTGNKWE